MLIRRGKFRLIHTLRNYNLLELPGKKKADRLV
jgi:hypothetical protein